MNVFKVSMQGMDWDPNSTIPYKVYDYMQQVYTPVLVCLEPSIHPHRLGREKVFAISKPYNLLSVNHLLLTPADVLPH